MDSKNDLPSSSDFETYKNIIEIHRDVNSMKDWQSSAESKKELLKNLEAMLCQGLSKNAKSPIKNLREKE